MECPVCGKECDDLNVVSYEAPYDEIVEYVFSTLISRGYAISYDDLTFILDIVQHYMEQYGEESDEKST